MLAPVITELAVMTLPLNEKTPNSGQNDSGRTAAGEQNNQAAAPMPEASAAQRQYANQLTASLIDTGYMRRIGMLKHKANRATNTHDKIELLGAITDVELERKNLQSQIFGSAAG